VILLLLFLVAATYATSSLENGFVYDDFQMILSRKGARSVADVAGLFAEPSFPNLPYYRPVTTTTLMLQRAVHGDNPAPYHLFNILLIGVAALLTNALLRLPAFNVEKIPALLASALFCLHPIASSVVYPASSGRETLLPSALTLLAVYAYLRPGRKWYGLALFAFAAALFSKEQAVIVPVLFLLADLLGLSGEPPGRTLSTLERKYGNVCGERDGSSSRSDDELDAPNLRGGATKKSARPVATRRADGACGRSLRWSSSKMAKHRLPPPALILPRKPHLQTLPYLRSSVLSQWMLRYLPITPIMLIYIGVRRLLFEGTEFTFGSLGGPFLSIAYALQDIFLPFVELHYEPTTAIWLSWPRLAVSLSLLILMILLAIRLWPSIHRVAWFWLGWFVVNLLPTANLLKQEAPFDDRYVFLASLSVFAMTASIASGFWSREPAARLLLISGLVLVACSAAISHHRASYFRDDASFSRQWLKTNPGSVNAHFDMGAALVRRSEFEQAIKHYTEVLRIRPGYTTAHNNLGDALLKSGRVAESLPYFSKALQLNPGYADAHYNMATALAQQNQLQEAIQYFSEVLRLRPSFAEAHNNLGNVLAKQKRLDEAIEHYSKALQAHPDNADAHNNWANALVEQGKLEESIDHYSTALEIRPDFVEAKRNLSVVLQYLRKD